MYCLRPEKARLTPTDSRLAIHTQQKFERKSGVYSHSPAQCRLAHTIEAAAAEEVGEASCSGAERYAGNAAPRVRDWRRTAVLRASKSHALALQERERPLAEYMALPASQYSVLDAKRIERIDDSTFRCYVGGLRFLNFVVEPVLTVSVIVEEGGPTVKLLSTKLEGSSIVQSANDRFDATMTNVVRWGDTSEVSTAEPRQRELRSDTCIQVALDAPAWLPMQVLEGTGSGVMQRVLNRMVPRFLAQLQADYELWSSGDESRKPIGTGQL